MFLHSFHPQSIIISLGLINLYWYGLFISLGIVAGFFVSLKLAGLYKIEKDLIWELSFYLILSGFSGAKLYYIIAFWPYFLSKPSEIIKFWHAGLSIHGAIIGGLIGLWLFSRKRLISFWQLADLISPSLALGQAIGRWGNYFNQELFGRPTNLPWGIPIDQINRPENFSGFTYFHPTFLYESILNLAIFFILLNLHRLKFKNKKIPNGNIFFSYLILYSLARFSMEFIRIEETPLILGIRLAQFVSLFIIVISLFFLLGLNLRKKN